MNNKNQVDYSKLKNLLPTISIEKIDLLTTIISKCGEHNDDKLIETIGKKMDDIQNCGYCLWAHGNLNPEHTRKFCKKQKDMYVIMPTTLSNSTKDGQKYAFKKWIDETGVEHDIPEKMNEVTGAQQSNRAFFLDGLYLLEENCNDFNRMLENYLAININSTNEACKTLNSSCSNKCIKIKSDRNIEEVKKCFNKNFENNNKIILIGKLCKPYHVELKDCIEVEEK